MLKKQEAINDKEKRAEFLYRVNVLPRILFASHFNPYTTEGASYVRPNDVTQNDWFLKVALQLDILLTHHRSVIPTLVPTVYIRTWGKIASKQLIASSVTLLHEKSWGHEYTTVIYKPENFQAADWQQQLRELFMLTTPFTLSHAKEVFGIEE